MALIARRQRAVLDELPDVVQRRCIACADWWPDDDEFYPRHANGGHPKPRCWACDNEIRLDAKRRRTERRPPSLATRIDPPPRSTTGRSSHARLTGALNEREVAILYALEANDWRQDVTAHELSVSRSYVCLAARKARAQGRFVGLSTARWGSREST